MNKKRLEDIETDTQVANFIKGQGFESPKSTPPKAIPSIIKEVKKKVKKKKRPITPEEYINGILNEYYPEKFIEYFKQKHFKEIRHVAVKINSNRNFIKKEIDKLYEIFKLKSYKKNKPVVEKETTQQRVMKDYENKIKKENKYNLAKYVGNYKSNKFSIRIPDFETRLIGFLKEAMNGEKINRIICHTIRDYCTKFNISLEKMAEIGDDFLKEKKKGNNN